MVDDFQATFLDRPRRRRPLSTRTNCFDRQSPTPDGKRFNAQLPSSPLPPPTNTFNMSPPTIASDEHESTAPEGDPVPSTSGGNSSSDSSSGTTTDQDQELKIDDTLLEGIKQGRQESIHQFLPIALRLITGKNTHAEQFDSIMNQRLSKFVDEKSEITSTLQATLRSLLKREEQWKIKYDSHIKICQELNDIIDHLKANPNAKPKIQTRTIGLQVNISPNIKSKEDCVQSNIKIPYIPTTGNSATSTDTETENIVNITDNDENKVIVINDTLSTSNCEMNLPSPLINGSSPALNAEKLPCSEMNIPNNSEDILIDLTGDDEYSNTQLSNINQQSRQQALNLPSTAINSAYIRGPSTSAGFTRPIQLSTVSSTLNGRNLQPSRRQFRFNSHLSPIYPSPPIRTNRPLQHRIVPFVSQHPAPAQSKYAHRGSASWKKLPSAPIVNVERNINGIIMSWNMVNLKECARIKKYQIFSYHEVATNAPQTETWTNIGAVSNLKLPIAVTLANFISGEKYYFAVRAVDMHNRNGPFSKPIRVYMP